MKTSLIASTLVLISILITACNTHPTIAGSGSPSSDTKKVRYERPVQVASKESQFNIPYRSLNTSKVIDNFAFGSCNEQNTAQPLWAVIAKQKPDLMLMMGDNVYASTPEQRPFMDQYIKLNQNEAYKSLRESTPFLATWDDHDFGQADGGYDNPDKEEARRVFLNYWSYIKTNFPKNQKGIYHSRILGEKKQHVQFIMLDTRWDRSPLMKNPEDKMADVAPSDPALPARIPRPYIPITDKKAKLLGEDQWSWLERELQKPAALRILVSSIQLIPQDHGFEKWGNFPSERERFFNLLRKHKIKNLVILSGDRHLASVAKLDVPKVGVIYEMTASSLNKPTSRTLPEKDTTYIGDSFLKSNYGLARIDWSRRILKLEIRDEQNAVKISQDVKF